MSPRGPKPEPASVKLAKGNTGRRPIVDDGSIVDGDAPAAPAIRPPSWLKKEGLKVWERLAPRLIALRLLGPADVETFGRYCRNFARWLKMQDTLDKEGETYESESAHGKLKRAHPAFLISDRLDRKLESVEDRFGLNPAERQRIMVSRAAAGAQGEMPLSGGRNPTAKPAAKPAASTPAPAKSPIGLLQ